SYRAIYSTQLTALGAASSRTRVGFRIVGVMVEPQQATKGHVVSDARTQKTAAGVESRAIWVSISFTALAVIVGLIAFSNKLTPLSADYSVGTIAGWTAGIAAGASALIGRSEERRVG